MSEPVKIVLGRYLSECPQWWQYFIKESHPILMDIPTEEARLKVLNTILEEHNLAQGYDTDTCNLSSPHGRRDIFYVVFNEESDYAAFLMKYGN